MGRRMCWCLILLIRERDDEWVQKIRYAVTNIDLLDFGVLKLHMAVEELV